MDIPDIPGYRTLVCDFNLHTVFSDGLVWPTVRVDEAWREGLDAIAITDHLEYLPFQEDVRTGHNRAWEIARDYSEGKDLIVIAGTEITRGIPPGHLNALFIKDADPILKDDPLKAIEEAAGQGAFIIWNQHGWKGHQPDTLQWLDIHTRLFDKGWLHGIEVANDRESYPVAIDWAKERELTMIGSSDEHDPFLHTISTAENHRTCTFVFAAERSEGGIREALFNGRTAAFCGDSIIGKSSLLKALFLASVHLSRAEGENAAFTLHNPTDLVFEIILVDRVYEDWKVHTRLKPGYAFTFRPEPGTSAEDIQLQVLNLITGAQEVLTFPLSGFSMAVQPGLEH